MASRDAVQKLSRSIRAARRRLSGEPEEPETETAACASPQRPSDSSKQIEQKKPEYKAKDDNPRPKASQPPPTKQTGRPKRSSATPFRNQSSEREGILARFRVASTTYKCLTDLDALIFRPNQNNQSQASKDPSSNNQPGVTVHLGQQVGIFNRSKSSKLLQHNRPPTAAPDLTFEIKEYNPYETRPKPTTADSTATKLTPTLQLYRGACLRQIQLRFPAALPDQLLADLLGEIDFIQERTTQLEQISELSAVLAEDVATLLSKADTDLMNLEAL